MTREEIERRVEELVLPVAAPLGIEVVAVEFVGAGRSRILRIYLDKDGGVTLDDCADVSRELSALLDVEDFIPGRYNLEVSSPGLDRPLKKISDFQRFSGQEAVVRTRVPHEDGAGGSRRTFHGVIRGVEGESVLLDSLEGPVISIPLQNISKAHLKYQF